VALRFELKDGDRTLAVYGKKDTVGRMLDAVEPRTVSAPKLRTAKRKRPALGRGVDPKPTALGPVAQ